MWTEFQKSTFGKDQLAKILSMLIAIPGVEWDSETKHRKWNRFPLDIHSNCEDLSIKWFSIWNILYSYNLIKPQLLPVCILIKIGPDDFRLALWDN